MGIPQLNQFMQQHCDNGIREIHLNDLRGKIIVIDISIYLYKFLSEGSLVENFYLMITKFRQFNIVPLFVFDGKPPPEKNSEINYRKQKKNDAKLEYDELLIKYNREQNIHKRTNIKSSLDSLKRQFVKLTHDDIAIIKLLIHSYGVSSYDAIGEADVTCAALVNSGKAYACLSEDMDLFVYGCKRVLRYLSLLNSTVIEYHLECILDELDMTHCEFKQICIISGCDYVKNTRRSFYSTIELFKKYKESCNDDDDDDADACNDEGESFYDWIISNTNYFTDDINFENIERLFNIDDSFTNELDSITIFNSSPNNMTLTSILENHGFIFV